MRAARHRHDAIIPNVNGEKIYQLRREAHLSLDQLAYLGTSAGHQISRSRISDAENGRGVSPAALQAIAYALATELGRSIHVQDLMRGGQP